MVSSGRTLLIQVLLRTLLMQVQLSSRVLTMEPEIDWSMKIALISEASLDTHIPPDITFKLNEDGVEHKIGAHKMLMGMVSPVFNKLLIKMDALDKKTKELFVKGTTYGAFNIMKNAVYGMVPMSSSLKGKSVPELFSIYDLVTRYQIPELRQVVHNHLASFPLTDDTVLEVAADARDHLLTFEEEARSLLARCAAHLKPKFKTVQSVLEYFAQNTENKEILHELLVLTNVNKDNNLSIASALAIDCRQEPCQNEVGFVPNRGDSDGHSGDKDGHGFREGRVYGGGRDGAGHNRGRGGSGYGRGRDYDGYGGVGDDSEYGGGGYGRVGDNRDYGGDGRYGGVRNDGGYRGGGGYSRSRDNSEYSGGNGYGGSPDERGYRGGGEYGGRYRGKGEYDKGRDGGGYREENVYGRGRDDGGDRGKGGYGGKYGGGRDDGYGGDIRGKDVRGYKGGGYGGSTDGAEYGGGRYNGGDRNGGGFKGGRGRDGGEFLRGDYGRNERGNY